MPAITYDKSFRDTRVAREVTVLACVPAPLSGTSGTPIDLIGVFESAEINLKREYADTTGAADLGNTSRALRWGKGSLKLTGFSRGAGSKLAAVYAAGSHVIFQLSEAATGDQYQLMCTNEDFAKSLGKSEANKDTISLGVESIPYYAPGPSGTLAAIPLDV